MTEQRSSGRRYRTVAVVVAALMVAGLSFGVGLWVGSYGDSDVRSFCLVTAESASKRLAEVGDFVYGDSGCIDDEYHICFSADELYPWQCEDGRP
jgi:hypothetical protein